MSISNNDPRNRWLTSLMEKISSLQSDNKFNDLPLDEQLDTETYVYLAEAMDLGNVYPYSNIAKFEAVFTDANGVTHFSRIVYQPMKVPKFDAKFGFFDEKDKPCYDRPNVHYNLGPDEKIFNTHLKILIEEFLGNQSFFEKAKQTAAGGKLYLPATDYPRYRLYRMALNKLLDKSKYELVDDPAHKNGLILMEKQPLDNGTKSGNL
jgi:hypothetical protein